MRWWAVVIGMGMAACAPERYTTFSYSGSLGEGEGGDGLGLGAPTDPEAFFPAEVRLVGLLAEQGTSSTFLVDEGHVEVFGDCELAAEPVCDVEGCEATAVLATFGACAVGMALDAQQGPGGAGCFELQIGETDEAPPLGTAVVATCEDAMAAWLDGDQG